MDDRTRARQRLKGVLSPPARIPLPGQGPLESEAHGRYLRELVLPHPAMKAILEEDLDGGGGRGCPREALRRCHAATFSIHPWRLKPAVDALMSFKGFQIVAAMITISELGNLQRFEHPRQLMSLSGPGADRKQQRATGADRDEITKCGNPHARWLLIECSQHYATARRRLAKSFSVRQEGQPAASVLKTSWNAQNRLHRRYMRLMARRLQRNKAMVAVARELCGFIWELLRTQACYQAQSSSV